MKSPSNLPRLGGTKIAVVVENKFIAEEIASYRTAFTMLGAEIEFVSRIWYGDYKPPSVTFYSDVDPLDQQPWETPHRIEVCRDVSAVELKDFDAIIMAGNYASVRLRFADLSLNDQPFDPRAHVQTAPVAQLFAKAMRDKAIVKGALCHGLWILTPFPELLKARRVICHSVVMADVLNCDAIIENNATGVVVDDDLVTGFSKHEVLPFIATIAQQVAGRRVVGSTCKTFS